ncbi:MAG: M48 family metalloprotease [Fimbriimonas sp.]
MLNVFLAALALAPQPVATEPAQDFYLPAGGSKLRSLVREAWESADDQAKDLSDHAKAVQSDKDEGKKYSALAEKELKLSKDTAMLERLQKIGTALAATANKGPVKATWGDKHFSQFDYTFKLVEDKDVNAFSLPGGYIYFNEGLIKFAESDDEIAGVVAHEIAHASLRHVATLQKEQSKLSAIQLPLIIAAILSGNSETIGGVLTGTSLFGAAKQSGWSVRAEQAADFAGFQYMLKSDYDPTGMLTFMERLAREERSKPAIDWGIFRTHPPGRERADSLARNMQEAGVPIRRSKVASSFRATPKQVSPVQVEVLFGGRHIATLSGTDAVDRSTVVVERLNAFFDSMPELYDVSSGASGEVLGRNMTLLTITSNDADG